MSRNADPVWVLDQLPLDVAPMGWEATDAVLGLDLHSLVRVENMPAAGTAPTDAWLFVEGWEETVRFGEWELTLNVSDFARTAPGPAWDDVDAGLAWDDVDPELTWDAMVAEPPSVAVLEGANHG